MTATKSEMEGTDRRVVRNNKEPQFFEIELLDIEIEQQSPSLPH
eukprot:CAMPEP_0202979480 /NCGR_PEP_ID=MMETSP1396-20130829/85611_1 /ASSEMBLY_ACC=CAM_ASM_000872 /TAXON_ID= /ORGANISM="Pseudokeronopsis sp., Strain Brazil" /LENGTH=43 /DNA_ID= /DNA_START= /DNA_END= /DNA_ORIENTATION=